MSAIDFKAYTTRAAELESAIYTQKELMKQYEEHLENQRPLAPVKRTPSPAPSEPGSYVREEEGKAFITPFVVGGIFSFFSLYVLAVGEWSNNAIPIIMIGIVVLLFVRAFFKAAEISKFNAYNKQIHKQQRYQYKNLVIMYSAEKRQINAEYEQACSKYELQIEEHNKKTTELMAPHKELLKNLENALEEHYALNILFPKYRNMVAVITINEYLMSGRCYELEGPDGAYNLYEMELRQNVIVGQLSYIVNSLEEIKNNQFLLYQELVKAKSTIDALLQKAEDIEDNLSMDAYFTETESLLRSSPRFFICEHF